MTRVSGLRSRFSRCLVISLAATVTAAFGLVKFLSSTQLFGLSVVFDFYLLALFWVLVLWALGLFRSAPPAQPERTLDNVSWHLDSAHEAGAPESRAALVGGLFLSWVVRREGLSRAGQEGMDEALSRFLEGISNLVHLYEAFGGKLTTGILRPEFAAFATQYLAPDAGAYFDDLAVVLGPHPFAIEPADHQIAQVHDLIDQRYGAWKPDEGSGP